MHPQSYSSTPFSNLCAFSPNILTHHKCAERKCSAFFAISAVRKVISRLHKTTTHIIEHVQLNLGIENESPVMAG